MRNRTTNPRRGGPRGGRARRFHLEALEARTVLSGAPSGLLIQLQDASYADVSAAAARAGASLFQTLEPGVFQADGSSLAMKRLAGRLAVTPGVGYVEPLRTFSVEATADDPYYSGGSLWGLSGANGVGAADAWADGQGTSKVIVGVVDSGIDYDHPDLYLNVWINQAEIPASRRANLTDFDGDGLITFRDLNYVAADGSKPNQGAGKISDMNGDGRISGSDLLASLYRTSSGGDSGLGGWANGVSDDGDRYVDDIIGWNFVNNTNRPFDDNGHGTHVSGIIGATGGNGVGTAGVNWQVQIMPLKFLNASGTGYDSSAASAVRYAADHGAQVTNNSYGGAGAVSSTLASAIGAAAAANSVFIAAAGNLAVNTDVTSFSPGSSAAANVVAVAAIDSNGALASFSNFGRTTVDIAAPGVGIISTLPGGRYGSMSGTSMAAPFVSGAAALLLASHPDWTYTQVVDQLLSTARPLAGLQGKVATGGTLDLGAAIRAARPPAPRPIIQLGYAGADAATQGSWRGAYGSSGRLIPGQASALPAGTSAAVDGASTYAWARGTSDPRGLQDPSGAGRSATTWFANGSFTVRLGLGLSDGQTRRVSLYFLDWDSGGRTQRVEMLDASGRVLDSQSLADFRGGAYLSWTVSGDVSFRIVQTRYSNAVLSGIFLD